MQSGISASQELLSAFKTFISSPTQRFLLAGIESEQLVPTTTIPLQSSDFTSDLPLLQPHLIPTSATYILLKLDPSSPDGYAAVTYVPNSAPVRQKMLFASTRLTLVRELGVERFRQTIFATEAAELTPEGWARHEAHEKSAAPLTAEEAGLAGVKEAETREGGSGGTGARRGHVARTVDVPTGEGVLEALACLMEGDCRGTLVQLKYKLPDETLLLESSADSVGPEQVAGMISGTEPRYAFYSHPTANGGSGGGGEEEQQQQPYILFLYTCPSGSKIKERMIYSTSKSWTRTVAERDAGLVISRSLEATEPGELTVDVLGGEEERNAEAPATGAKAGGFARPKRPGRR